MLVFQFWLEAIPCLSIKIHCGSWFAPEKPEPVLRTGAFQRLVLTTRLFVEAMLVSRPVVVVINGVPLYPVGKNLPTDCLTKLLNVASVSIDESARTRDGTAYCA